MNTSKIMLFTSWPINEVNGVNFTIKELLNTKSYKDSFLFCPSTDNPDKWELYQNNKIVETVNFTPLRRKHFGLFDTASRLIFQPVYFFRLLVLFKKYEIKIFHMHFLSHFGYIFAPLCRLLRIDLFVSLHGSDVYRPHNSLIYSISRNFLLKHAYFFCCSKAIANEAMQVFTISKNRMKVIYHGVPRDIKEYGSEKEENSIIAVGRLDKVKGFDILLDAIHILVNEYQQNPKLKIIGGGVEKQALENQISKLDLKNNVSMLGQKKRDEVYIELSKSKIFVLSSRQEALPLSILEALSYKNAIAAFDVGGVSEIISLTAGIIPAENTAEALAYSLNIILVDKQLQKELAEKGNLLCKQAFCWQHASEQYISTYALQGLDK